MKYFKYIMCLIIFSGLIIFATSYKTVAEESDDYFYAELTSEYFAAEPGRNFSMIISFKNIPEGGLKEAYFDLQFDTNVLEFVRSDTPDFKAVESKRGTVTVSYNYKNNKVEAARIVFKVKNRDPKVSIFTNLKLITGVIYDINGKALMNVDRTQKSTSVEIREMSWDANLLNLTVKDNELVPEFSPLVYNYTVETVDSYIKLEATLREYNRFSSGDGTNIFQRNLQYGINTIEIHSTDDTKYTRIYTVKVTRIDTRDGDATLASIAGVPDFQKDVYNYNIELPTNQGVFTVDARTSKSTSSIKYSVQNTTMTFDYGETKRVMITVNAENGNELIYTLNITRKDDRSTNADVKSITLSGVDLKYDPEVFSYRVVVDNATKEIDINAVAADSRTSLEGIGKKPLATGSNVYRVIATSESGERKVYTITIVRKDKNNDVSKMSRNTKVLSLRLNGQEIKLQEGIYAYSVSVDNDVTQAEFVCDVEDEKTLALLEGNRNLKVGLNTFKVTITAEYGNSVMYDIIVERKELKKVITNTKSDILHNIRNGSDAVLNVSVPFKDTNRVADNDIISALQSTKKAINYSILNENRGTAYTISVDGNNITQSGDLDFNVNFDPETKDKIDKQTGATNSVYVSLKENDNFKGKLKLKVFVGGKFNMGNTLTLYHYDKTNDKVEMVKEALKVKNNYTEFEIDKLGDYVLIDRTQVSSTGGGSSSMVAILGVVAGIIVIAIIVGIVKSKH